MSSSPLAHAQLDEQNRLGPEPQPVAALLRVPEVQPGQLVRRE